MALDEPRDDDVRIPVADFLFVMRKDEEGRVGAQRDVRVDYLEVPGEIYAATTLSAECLAWFDPDE